MKKKPKIPIILYEEPKPGEPANPLPYIEVKLNDEMPRVLFIQEYKETGEFEVDTGQGSMPIVDMLIHSFVQLDYLKDKVDEETYDKIRVAIGMEPLKKAQEKGQKILDKVYEGAGKHREELQHDEEARAKRAFKLGEDLRQKAEQFLKEEKEEEN